MSSVSRAPENWPQRTATMEGFAWELTTTYSNMEGFVDVDMSFLDRVVEMKV